MNNPDCARHYERIPTDRTHLKFKCFQVATETLSRVREVIDTCYTGQVRENYGFEALQRNKEEDIRQKDPVVQDLVRSYTETLRLMKTWNACREIDTRASKK